MIGIQRDIAEAIGYKDHPYDALLEAPDTRVVVFQYPLSIPSVNLFSTWQIEAMIDLFNENIAQAVAKTKSDLPPSKGDRLIMTPEEVLKRVDENTIGVVPTLGVTFTCDYEPVEAVAKALDAHQAATGLDVPMHVDGASGGFIAPFVDPDLVWDFRIPRVKSINTSGHKFGLAPLGVGWVIWRDGVPNGETLAQVAARADRLIADARAVDGDVLLFSHGHFLRVLASRWLDLPPDSGRLFLLSTASLSVLGFDAEGTQPAMVSWNDTTHLRG